MTVQYLLHIQCCFIKNSRRQKYDFEVSIFEHPPVLLIRGNICENPPPSDHGCIFEIASFSSFSYNSYDPILFC